LNRITRHLVWLLASLTTISRSTGSPDWEEGGGFRWASLEVRATGRSGFTLRSPAESGLVWTNLISEEQVARRYNMVGGGGVAAGDFDGDGLCDLYFCNRGGDNALFRNLGNGRFQNVTAAAGVACPDQSSTGATFADLDGDGRLDLLVSSFWGPNACFRNLGQGRWTNITARAGLLPRGGATSLALGDVDGDGDLDLYLSYFGIESILREGGRFSFNMVGGQPVVTGRHARRLRIQEGQLVELGEQDVLYLNDGRARFTAVNWAERFRDEAGQPVPAAPMDFGLSVQVRDFNEDGFPDIYACKDFQTPDRAWLNDGRGHFRALPPKALRSMSYASMGIDFADLDRDGRLDFITVEMLSREPAHRLRQLSSMPVKDRPVGLIEDRESVPRNALFWNRGDGTYAEIAWFSGVAASDWSWTPVFLDVDLDGFEDLLVSAGSLYDVMDRDAAAAAARLSAAGVTDARKLLPLYPRLDHPNAAFRNRGDLTFEDVSRVWGFDSRQFAQGAALADLDNDGDLDVVMNCANAAPLVCRNDASAPRVAVRLKGLPPNTQGIGAKVRLFGGAVPVQIQEVICGGRYLSGDQPMRVFAAGRPTNTMRLEVTWRSGRWSVVGGVRANRIYEIDEAGAGTAPDLPSRGQPAAPAPWFEDVSAVLNHTHHEEVFDDFERQPLLPFKLSQSGPGVAWQDLDGDGWDDLVIGSGKGGKLAAYRNDGKGGFERWEGLPWDEIVTRDQTGLVGMGPGILAGSANYEDGLAAGSCAREYLAGANGTADGLPAQPSSTGPLALGDLDGDGSLELFVGGRVVPGRYPEAATSLLFRRRQGRWELDGENTRRLARVGLVSGAVWSDLDGDGFPELVLACEWGPVRVFRNQAGRLTAWNVPLCGAPEPAFEEPGEADGSSPALGDKPSAPRQSNDARRRATTPATLHDLTGWWHGVTTGDFDGDGRMDLVASNWGRNSRYRASPEHPCKIYYGDPAGRGRVDLVEVAYDQAQQKEVAARDLNAVGAAFPFVRAKFSTHAAYAQASVENIYGERLSALHALKAATLESLVLLNRGDHFVAIPLPPEAQFSPAFAAGVADLDGDGDDDVFLSQNFFATQPETSRLDAGRGLWLAGDGRGGFAPVPGQRSGIRVYGEQRGAALGDYDGDGRVDVVVTQNGAATKLYRNVGAKPGLRVRLVGPGGNPAGVGAQVRLQDGESAGPAREIHAGSGYWSQDSSVVVISGPPSARALWVRWPGGRTTTTVLPPGALEVQIEPSGALRVLR
jgi:hypothetical protein